MIGMIGKALFTNLCFNGGCLFLAKCYLNKGVLLDKKAVLFVLLTGLCDTIGDVYHNGVSSFLTVLSGFFLAYCFFRGGKGKIRRLFSAVETMVFFYVNIIYYVMAMYTLYHSNDTDLSFLDRTDYCVDLCAVFLFVLLVYTYVSLYRKKITLELQVREKILLLAYCLFLLTLFCFLQIFLEESKATLPGYFSAICMCMLTLLEILAFFGLIKNKLTDYYKRGQEYQQEYMELELAHFREYKQAQEETKRVRHDMKNNLACISMLLEEGKEQEAKTYVSQLLGEVNAFSPRVVTGDEMLDAIVASKWNKMEKAHIAFSLEGVLDQGLHWKPIDVCTVFSNGLDNAIEACEKVEGERSISLSLRFTRNFYYIVLSNTMKESSVALRSKKRLEGKVAYEQSTENEQVVIGSRYTTKKNKELHGYGLENMERTVKKYDGTMHIVQEKNRFTVTIMVPLETKS